MDCIICKNGTPLEGKDTVTFEKEGHLIIIREVPGGNYSALYGYLSIFSRKRKMGLSYPHSYTLCDVRRLHFRNHVFGLFLCA